MGQVVPLLNPTSTTSAREPRVVGMGYISLHRELLDHWLWKSKEPFSDGQAFLDMLLLANYKPAKLMIKGQLIEVDRGQLAHSMVTLAGRWNWSRGKVIRFFTKLKKDSMVVQQTNNATTITTLCNYNSFQSSDTSGSTASGTADGTAPDHQPITNNKDNKENKKDTYVSLCKSVIESFNKIVVALPEVKVLNKDRTTKLKNIIRDHDSFKNIEHWNGFFEYINGLDFLMGRAESGWTASFDWVIAPKNFVKIIEGNYERS